MQEGIQAPSMRGLAGLKEQADGRWSCWRDRSGLGAKGKDVDFSAVAQRGCRMISFSRGISRRLARLVHRDFRTARARADTLRRPGRSRLPWFPSFFP